MGMGVPYNIMVAFEWAANQKKESNKRKEVLLNSVLQTEENVVEVEGSWQFGGSLTFCLAWNEMIVKYSLGFCKLHVQDKDKKDTFTYTKTEPSSSCDACIRCQIMILEFVGCEYFCNL